MVGRLWQAVRGLPRILQVLLVVAVVALAWSVPSAFTDDDSGGDTDVEGGPTTTATITNPAPAPSATTVPGTTPSPDTPTTRIEPSQPAAATGEDIGPTGDPVEMEPNEACPSGRYVEILGLLVCEDP